jgi:cupin fold WbuC family metalloprotein
MKEISDCIFYAGERIVKVNRQDVEILKEKAYASKSVRSRLCMHESINAQLHEMFIVHFRDTYVRPHKHLGKSESIHIIEGFADLIIFDHDGQIKDVISMGEYHSGERFYYRMDEEFYHTIMINADVCVFHETTKGPFDRERDTIVAPWSPPLEETELVKRYMDHLRKRKEVFKSKLSI